MDNIINKIMKAIEKIYDWISFKLYGGKKLTPKEF